MRIGNPEGQLGILAAAGAAWRLVELVGEPVAKEMLLAGRVLGADESSALRLFEFDDKHERMTAFLEKRSSRH